MTLGRDDAARLVARRLGLRIRSSRWVPVEALRRFHDYGKQVAWAAAAMSALQRVGNGLNQERLDLAQLVPAALASIGPKRARAFSTPLVGCCVSRRTETVGRGASLADRLRRMGYIDFF